MSANVESVSIDIHDESTPLHSQNEEIKEEKTCQSMITACCTKVQRCVCCPCICIAEFLIGIICIGLLHCCSNCRDRLSDLCACNFIQSCCSNCHDCLSNLCACIPQSSSSCYDSLSDQLCGGIQRCCSNCCDCLSVQLCGGLRHYCSNCCDCLKRYTHSCMTGVTEMIQTIVNCPRNTYISIIDQIREWCDKLLSFCKKNKLLAIILVIILALFSPVLFIVLVVVLLVAGVLCVLSVLFICCLCCTCLCCTTASSLIPSCEQRH